MVHTASAMTGADKKAPAMPRVRGWNRILAIPKRMMAAEKEAMTAMACQPSNVPAKQQRIV